MRHSQSPEHREVVKCGGNSEGTCERVCSGDGKTTLEDAEKDCDAVAGSERGDGTLSSKGSVMDSGDPAAASAGDLAFALRMVAEALRSQQKMQDKLCEKLTQGPDRSRILASGERVGNVEIVPAGGTCQQTNAECLRSRSRRVAQSRKFVDLEQNCMRNLILTSKIA